MMCSLAKRLLTICWSFFFVNVADADVDDDVVVIVLLLITFDLFVVVALTTDVDISHFHFGCSTHKTFSMNFLRFLHSTQLADCLIYFSRGKNHCKTDWCHSLNERDSFYLATAETRIQNRKEQKRTNLLEKNIFHSRIHLKTKSILKFISVTRSRSPTHARRGGWWRRRRRKDKIFIRCGGRAEKCHEFNENRWIWRWFSCVCLHRATESTERLLRTEYCCALKWQMANGEECMCEDATMRYEFTAIFTFSLRNSYGIRVRTNFLITGKYFPRGICTDTFSLSHTHSRARSLRL